MTRDSRPTTTVQLDPDEMARRAHLAGTQPFLDGYLSGLIAGITIGRDQVEDEIHRAWAPVVAHVRGLGAPRSRTHAELQRIRNSHQPKPVPTYDECVQSWAPAIAAHGRRHGATEQQIADTIVAELRHQPKRGAAA